MIADVLSFLVGSAIVVVTAIDIFQSVVVPRPTGRRLRASVAIGRRAWRAWRAVADRLDEATRERWLGTYAPLVLTAFLAFWATSLIVGYGLIFYALRTGVKPEPGFAEAFYFAGATALTVGYGDYAPVSAAARAVAMIAGASGLGYIAIGASFLFPIFGAYQQREVFVLLVGNRAGRPPSAVELLLHERGAGRGANASDLRDAERWFAELIETHLAYPILTWFRSTDPALSWIAVAETILDATALLLTTVDEPAPAEAELVQRLGVRFVDEFSRFLELADGDAALDAETFDRAYDRLAAAGLPLRARESAGATFAEMRRRYAGRLDVIARNWHIPRARDLGETS